jgi:uncharacterized protein YodC (DUF2158 family)
MLEKGDLVSLNSGGPIMQVYAIGSDGQVTCTWQSNSGWHFQRFPIICLTKMVKKPSINIIRVE